MTIYSLVIFLSQLEPGCFSISGSNCCFLTSIQIFQGAGMVIWYSYIFTNFPRFFVIHTVKCFSIVNEADDDFLEFSCFFYDPVDVGNLISGYSAFSKSIWTSGSSWFMYCWNLGCRILEDIDENKKEAESWDIEGQKT